MHIPPYQVNSKQLPQNFPRQFDAHIYFELKDFKTAELLRKNALEHFEGKEVFVGDLIGEAIGPHTLPMFELNFPKRLFSEVTLWLMYERKNLNVLVHELTGDDYRDHTQAAIWLGAVVPLHYDRLKT